MRNLLSMSDEIIIFNFRFLFYNRSLCPRDYSSITFQILFYLIAQKNTDSINQRHQCFLFFIRFIIRISVQFCYNFIFCSYACYLFIQKNFRFCCTNTVIRLIFFEKRTSTVFIFNLWIFRFSLKNLLNF